MKALKAVIGFDKDGHDIIVGDMVVVDRKLYRVTRISWKLIEDKAEKILELMRDKDLSIRTILDRKVSVLE